MPLGDVLVRHHPAAVRHRLARHRDDAAILDLERLGARRAVVQQGVGKSGDVLLGIGGEEGSVLDAALDQLADRAAGLHHVGRQPVHAQIALVEQHEARLRIDTPKELDYYQHGGILQYVLWQLAGNSKAA